MPSPHGSQRFRARQDSPSLLFLFPVPWMLRASVGDSALEGFVFAAPSARLGCFVVVVWKATARFLRCFCCGGVWMLRCLQIPSFLSRSHHRFFCAPSRSLAKRPKPSRSRDAYEHGERSNLALLRPLCFLPRYSSLRRNRALWVMRSVFASLLPYLLLNRTRTRRIMCCVCICRSVRFSRIIRDLSLWCCLCFCLLLLFRSA